MAESGSIRQTQAGNVTVAPSATAPPVPPKSEAQETATGSASSDFPGNKKRKPDAGDYRDSTFFKIRTLVKELRPYFTEVVCTPNFRECKAADEIRKKLKVMKELTNQLKMELSKIEKTNQLAEGRQSTHTESNEARFEKSHGDKKTDAPVPEKSTMEEKLPNKNANTLADGLQGTYIVGGSPMGWNFIMFLGNSSVYYGETNESSKSRKRFNTVKSSRN